MSKLKSVNASTPARGSVAACEWWTGDKKSGFVTCGRDAVWQHIKETYRGRRVWRLCEQHKRALLESYNDQSRGKEEPQWKRIKPLNAPHEQPGATNQKDTYAK